MALQLYNCVYYIMTDENFKLQQKRKKLEQGRKCYLQANM